MTHKQLYTYLYFSISYVPTIRSNNNFRFKKSLSLILTNLIFFYIKHLLITQNKKHHKHVHTIGGTKTLLVGL